MKIDPRLFPTLLIILDVAAGTIWACHGDLRKAIYWIAAAILTICVTF